LNRARVLLGQLDLLVLLVPVGPFYIGWTLSTGGLLPGTRAFAMAMLSIVPFLGAGTVLLNDAYDVDVDTRSRRKGGYRASLGLASPRSLVAAAAACMTVAVALAALASPWFLLWTAMLAALAVAYSVPPARLSRRPPWDLVANAVGIGVVCTLAGWSLERGPTAPPVAWLLTSALGTGAFFVLTALLDAPTDAAGGKRSVAVALGWGRACALGLALIAAADAGIVYMCMASVVLSPSFLWVAGPVIALELLVFPLVASRRASALAGAFAMAALLLVGNALIVLSHAGGLGPF
jgi:4-hydroxybenzoate polyprenyltransferase